MPPVTIKVKCSACDEVITAKPSTLELLNWAGYCAVKHIVCKVREIQTTSPAKSLAK